MAAILSRPQWVNCILKLQPHLAGANEVMENSIKYVIDTLLNTGIEYMYNLLLICYTAGIILCMCSGNERQRYIVTSSLIGWAYTQNGPWYCSVLR